MKYAKSSSVYALIVGIMMMCMWLFFIIAGLVPEFETRPAEKTLYHVDEISTAIILITAAIVNLKGLKCDTFSYIFRLGLLMYTLIVSPGYYLQSGDLIFVIMFGVLIVLSILFLFIHIKYLEEGSSND